LGKTHAELLDTISNDEFMYWLAMEQVDPIYDPWVANAWNCQASSAAFRKKVLPIETWLPIKPKKVPQSEAILKQNLAAMLSRVPKVKAQKKID
jgi:hypothetical protein